MERLVAFARQIQSLFLSDIFFPFWPIFESLFHPFYYKIVKKYREREREREDLSRKLEEKIFYKFFERLHLFLSLPLFHLNHGFARVATQLIFSSAASASDSNVSSMAHETFMADGRGKAR